ncbi:hypothetical protein PV04_04974 [Phialophora macrospora]|uniref:Uncharacterized protein n=1 Tax=Phialophora macrospora TaxID=1851006 RepID=A0A0D2CVB9_9EURO|nr:hypothetical protein PV04_04974 [Phialophora macrospora]
MMAFHRKSVRELSEPQQPCRSAIPAQSRMPNDPALEALSQLQLYSITFVSIDANISAVSWLLQRRIHRLPIRSGGQKDMCTPCRWLITAAHRHKRGCRKALRCGMAHYRLGGSWVTLRLA